MATVVITFFLFARFYVCKMDADCIEKHRDQLLSRREKRWSMNSQRLEEIVAELMKPISDSRRSFDTDLSALLEEYLTEAGLRALDAGEDSSPADAVAPNFAELALLLQQSANIYGRKVDCLYQHVLAVSDSLQNCTQEAPGSDGGSEAAPATPSAGRRRRRASALADFEHIELAAHRGARREPGAPRPPPTLPRMYIELEPRVITDADVPLHDYAGEPIGLLGDFQVTWRLHRGMLVDELVDGESDGEAALRPISLVELQAAIEAAAPPLPPAPADDSPPPSPLRASTPLPPDERAEPPPPPAKRERKRRREDNIIDIIQGSLKIFIGEELRQKLSEVEEFSIPTKWIKKVVEERKNHILSVRRRLRELDPNPHAEFPGWSGAGGGAELGEGGGAAPGADSDDDGFFEQSSAGESDASRASDASCAAVDVRRLGARVLRQLAPGAALSGAAALSAAARAPRDVSRLLLATLFLANAGAVEVVAGEPLSVNSFSLRRPAAAPRDEPLLR